MPSVPLTRLARWSLLLRQIKTTQTAAEVRNGRAVILRNRRSHAPLLIIAGNAYLSWIGASVRILGKKQWIYWEREAHRAINGIDCASGNLLPIELPQYPGRTLDHLLRDRTPVAVEHAFRAAVRSLREAHCRELRFPDGLVRRFSHGDATTRNVIVDPAHTKATWIDFEIVHTPNQPDVLRFADDLHALLCSAVEVEDRFCDPGAVEQLCHWVKQEYADVTVLEELAEMLSRTSNAYQMARGIVGDALRRTMANLLRNWE